MRYATIDILACPMCKFSPLILTVFNETKRMKPMIKIEKPFCKSFCGYFKKFISELSHIEIDCEECMSRDIVWGVLCCSNCKRVYPIILGIPFMYPDYLVKHNNKLKIIYKIFMNRYKGFSC